MAGDVLGAGEWPFGAPLGAVCRRERVAVPEALARSLEWLRARGPRAAAREGLFRRRADPHQVQLLRRRFQAPGPGAAPDRQPPLDAATDPHTVRPGWTPPAPAPRPGWPRARCHPHPAGRRGRGKGGKGERSMVWPGRRASTDGREEQEPSERLGGCLRVWFLEKNGSTLPGGCFLGKGA